jgi:hypothetical protein
MDSDRFKMSEQDALRAAASYDGPAIIDLDETLYLQNSTTNFLDCAAPGVAALVMLKLFDIIAPWRRTGGRATRDAWRVRLIMVVFPWTLARWQARCREQAAMLTNRPLLEALRSRGRPFIVATNGFYPIVQPLLMAMGCADVELIACRLDEPSDRLGGKADLVTARLGSAVMAEALVITDSADDIDILQHCRTPCLTRWASAFNPRPFGRVYLPGLYTAVVKRANPGGFNMVLVNQTFWLLIPLTSGHFSARILAASVPFFWSFWAVYEAGYRDNDLCAARYEDDPVLAPGFATFRHEHFELKAGLFALGLAAAGVLAIGAPGQGWLALAWVALLIVTRVTFWFYNRFDKSTRVWFYLPMQLQREAGFLLFATANAAGISAVVARALAKWIEYIVYRHARTVGVKGFTKMPLRFYRLLIFCVLTAATLATGGAVNANMAVTSVLLLVLFLANARTEILAVVRAAHRLDRSPEVRPDTAETARNGQVMKTGQSG